MSYSKNAYEKAVTGAASEALNLSKSVGTVKGGPAIYKSRTDGSLKSKPKVGSLMSRPTYLQERQSNFKEEMMGFLVAENKSLADQASVYDNKMLKEDELLKRMGVNLKPGPMSPSTRGAEGIDYNVSKDQMEQIITNEALLRGMDPTIALKIANAEGLNSTEYQSSVPRQGKGSFQGREDSYGPFQLYLGGGLGNDFEKSTGLKLRDANDLEGITKQIQFGLDKAATNGWGAWYGREPAGVGKKEGLSGAKAVNNWRVEK